MFFFKRKNPEEAIAQAREFIGSMKAEYRMVVSQIPDRGEMAKAEYAFVTLCAYLAQDKAGEGAWEYIGPAIMDWCLWAKSEGFDRKKEMAPLYFRLQAMKQAEANARKENRNVLEAVAAAAFDGGFEGYSNPDQIKGLVYAAVRTLVKRMDLAQYKEFKLPLITWAAN